MTGRRFGDDRRAVAANVSHVLAIGIASLLVVTLLFAANGYLANQQETAVRQGLESVGSNMANELTMLDGLQASQTNVSMQASHPDTIAGSSYTVRIEHGTECDVPSVTTESCLVLESVSPELTEYIPLQNRTAIEVTQGTQGRFRYVSTGSDATRSRAGPDRAVASVQPTFQLGIGAGVSDETFGSTDGGVTNLPPLATFRTDPSYPSVGSDITFTAFDDGVPGATDPDGDDSTLHYRWDFDDDGHWDHNGTGRRTTVPGGSSEYFTSPGVYNVTLNVTDRNGNGRSTYVSRNVSVSGLVYNEDLSYSCSTDDDDDDWWDWFDFDDDDDGCSVWFSLTNQWSSSDISVTGLFVNVTGSGDEFDVEDGVGFESEYDSSDDDYGRSAEDDTQFTVEGRGTIWPEGQALTMPAVDPGDRTRITLREIETGEIPDGEQFRIVVQHEVNGQTNATEFQDTLTSP